MCGSMVDIQSPIAEISEEKKTEEEGRKIEITGQKYNILYSTLFIIEMIEKTI